MLTLARTLSWRRAQLDNYLFFSVNYLQFSYATCAYADDVKLSSVPFESTS